MATTSSKKSRKGQLVVEKEDEHDLSRPIVAAAIRTSRVKSQPTLKHKHFEYSMRERHRNSFSDGPNSTHVTAATRRRQLTHEIRDSEITYLTMIRDVKEVR